MRKISLLFSLHRENGLCNVVELLKTLRAIDPEVVFGEVARSDTQFYDPRSLEGAALARFIALKPSCRQVPVDRYDIPPNFRPMTDAVFDLVEGTSPEYQELLEKRHQATNVKGFAYLNSDAFTEGMNRMHDIEGETIEKSGNPDLVRALALWRQVMAEREHAMIDNIGRYCRENVFDRGVFLVGAAHRNSILETIAAFSAAYVELIEWKITR
jgi:hypothetical protein